MEASASALALALAGALLAAKCEGVAAFVGPCHDLGFGRLG